MGSYLDMERLARLVRTKRGSKGLRETATAINGVSAPTLSRVENGKMPDLETFLLLCDWLEVPPTELIKNTEQPNHNSTLSTPEAIAIALQSDKNLEPAIASALASLFKAAYGDLCQRSSDS